MGETNKRHNRKIWRPCPVCKGRVVLGHRNRDWWVYCEDNASHIPQRFFSYAHEAIEAWNEKENKTCVEYFGCNDPDDGCLFDFGEVELCYDCVFEWLTKWRENKEAEQ